MVSITVRRSPDSYSVKIQGNSNIFVLPRPLDTQMHGLPQNVVEAITTCRKHETRELAVADMEKVALAAQPPTLEIFERMSAAKRDVFEVTNVKPVCRECYTSLADGALYTDNPHKSGTLICASCFEYIVSSDLEALEAQYNALKARLGKIRTERTAFCDKDPETA